METIIPYFSRPAILDSLASPTLSPRPVPQKCAYSPTSGRDADRDGFTALKSKGELKLIRIATTIATASPQLETTNPFTILTETFSDLPPAATRRSSVATPLLLWSSKLHAPCRSIYGQDPLQGSHESQGLHPFRNFLIFAE